MSDRLTFNHGASAFTPRLVGRHERGGRSRESTAAWSGPGPLARAGLSRAMARAERPDLAYWSVFAFTALLFFRPQDSLPMLEPLHLPDITALTALAAMAIGRATRGLPPVPGAPELAPLVVFAGIMVLTAPFSIWPSGALATFTDLFLKVVLVFVLLTHALSSPRLLRRFTWLIVAAMGYIAARGWIDYAQGENLLQGRLQGTVPGMMGNPNDLAMNMVTFVPFAAFIALNRGKLVLRLLAAFVALLMVGTIVFTKSRGGMLGLAVTGLLILAQAGRLRTPLLAVGLVGALAVPPLLPQSIWTRLSSIVNAEEDETGSRAARVMLLEDGWNTFVEHPFTGVGAGQFQNYNPPSKQELWRETHNVELQVLAELGLIGGIAFAWLRLRSGRTLYTTWQALRPRRKSERGPPAEVAFAPHELEWMRAHVAACIAAFGGWMVCAQFASIGYHWTLYLVLALIVAAREILSRRLEWASAGVANRGTAA